MKALRASGGPGECVLRATSLKESADGVERLIRRACDNGGQVGGFKRDVVTLLGYLIAHESHDLSRDRFESCG